MKRGIRVLFPVLFVSLFLVLGIGCTKYASQEDLQSLETAKKAALSAEKKQSDLQKEKGSLERKKAQAEDKLRTAEDEKAKVEVRLKELQPMQVEPGGEDSQ